MLKQQKKGNSDVATRANYGGISSLSCSKSTYKQKEIEGPRRLLPPFKVNTLKGRTQASLHLSAPKTSP